MDEDILVLLKEYRNALAAELANLDYYEWDYRRVLVSETVPCRIYNITIRMTDDVGEYLTLDMIDLLGRVRGILYFMSKIAELFYDMKWSDDIYRKIAKEAGRIVKGLMEMLITGLERKIESLESEVDGEGEMQ